MAGLRGVELVTEPDGCRSNNWLVSLRLTAPDPAVAEDQRKLLLNRAHASGLLLRPIWTPLHQLPIYQECSKGSLPVAESQAPRLLNLPSSPQLLQGYSQTLSCSLAAAVMHDHLSI